MKAERGQVDLEGEVVTALAVALIAAISIVVFALVNQHITITGSLAGSEDKLLIDTSVLLKLAVGGFGILVPALVVLRARNG